MKKYIVLSCLLTAFNLFCANYSVTDTITIKNNTSDVDLYINLMQRGSLISKTETLPSGESYGPLKRSEVTSLAFAATSAPLRQYKIDLTQANSLVVIIEYNNWSRDYYADVKSVQPPQLPPRQATVSQTFNIFVDLHKNSTGPRIKSLLNTGSTINIIATKYPYLLFGFSSEDKVPNDAKKLGENYKALKELLEKKQDASALSALEIAYLHLQPVMIRVGQSLTDNPYAFETEARLRNKLTDAEEYIRQSKEAYNSSSFKKEQEEQQQEQAEKLAKLYQMNQDLPDAYATLGVNDATSNEDIKKAFRTLSLKYHPDKGGNKEKFQEINNAWNIIKTIKNIH